MNKIEKDATIDAWKLAQRLLQKRTTKDRFNFPLTVEQTYSMLFGAYKAEVDYRWRTFRADTECTGCIKELARKTAAIPDGSMKFGILLCGTYGSGKSTLMRAFKSALDWCNSKGWFEEEASMSIYGAKDIAMNARGDYGWLRTISDLPMLGIDDLGREPKVIMEYGNEVSPIIDLLEHRYNEQLFTFVTTNLTPKEIRERYGDRIADRFNEMMDPIIFGAKSYREACNP